MDEIVAKTYTMDELLSKNNKRSRIVKVKKFSLVYVLIALLFINLLLYESLSGHNTAITVTAYAAENEMELSKDFVDFELSAMPFDGGSSEIECYINYNINFRCEGQDIRSITYTCSDQEVTRENKASASAYYVENMIIPIDEFGGIQNDNRALYGYYAPGENTANVTRLIGNSYSVNYEDQNNIQYGLIIAAKDEDNYRYSIEETIIKLEVHFNDGSVQHRKIIIKSSQDAFSDIQLRIQ
jgi:hypothetical protein